MKKLTTLLAILVISTTIFAQIPNPSFENWSGGAPVGWRNVGTVAATLTQSSDAYSGNYAAKLSVDAGSTTGGYIIGSDYDNIAPVYFNFWYKLNSVNGDMLAIASNLYCGNVGNGLDFNAEAVYFINTSTSVYKLFSCKYNYSTTCTEDTAVFSFNLDDSLLGFGGLNPNTYAIIDDLFFSNTSGIEVTNNNAAVLEPCTPNPATTIANIIYSIPISATVSIELYDILGHNIETLLNNTDQSPGHYKIPADVSSLSSGVYFYKLTVNGEAYTQKLVVAH